MGVVQEVFGVGLLLEEGGEGCVSALYYLAVKREEVSSLGRLHHFDSNQWSVACPHSAHFQQCLIPPLVAPHLAVLPHCVQDSSVISYMLKG